MKVDFKGFTELYHLYHTDDEYRYYIWLNSREGNYEDEYINSQDWCNFRFIRMSKNTRRYIRLSTDLIVGLGGEFSKNHFVYLEELN
tara:strand:+ start:348 stop:608 length:261 start_codon:yes stop_codon:yes gene_type:complete